MLELNTLTVDTVLTIHDHLVREFSETPDPIAPSGVRDNGLLESAVYRQHSGSRSYLKYDTPFLNAASLVFGLCNNHPFFNGNKRTALVSGLIHLDSNGLVLEQVTKDDLYRLMLRIAERQLSKASRTRTLRGLRPIADDEINSMADWLHKNARKIRRGEKNISYAQLYRILEQFGYKLGRKHHNKIEVLNQKKTLFGKIKWDCVYKVACPGDSHTVTLNEIKAIRRSLELDEEHGVDSESFYARQIVIDSFIQRHRNVLRRLART